MVTVTIDSVPPGLTLVIDGEELGVTPLVTSLARNVDTPFELRALGGEVFAYGDTLTLETDAFVKVRLADGDHPASPAIAYVSGTAAATEIQGSEQAQQEGSWSAVLIGLFAVALIVLGVVTLLRFVVRRVKAKPGAALAWGLAGAVAVVVALNSQPNTFQEVVEAANPTEIVAPTATEQPVTAIDNAVAEASAVPVDGATGLARQMAVTPESPGQSQTAATPVQEEVAEVESNALPLTTAPEPVGGADVYVVVPGDTLTNIARRHGVTVNALMAANGLASANLIRVGQRLNLAGGIALPVTPQAPMPAALQPAPQPSPSVLPSPSPVPVRRTCCKYCSKGKACGNSCISRSYTCRKGVGCACNAEDAPGKEVFSYASSDLAGPLENCVVAQALSLEPTISLFTFTDTY